MKKLFFICCIWISQSVFAQIDSTQNTKEVQIIHADKLQFYTNKQGKAIRTMVGSVQLKQDSTQMFCDSALLNKEENIVEMFGNVKITDGDSITATSNKLHYDGNTKKAKLIGNAHLTDTKMELHSETLHYDRSNNTGFYLNGGKLINDSTILTSEKGYYYANSKTAYFKDNVHIDDPKYQLDSDTLSFNTETKVAVFYGNTSIYNEESTIYCHTGTYRTQEQIATFGASTTIENKPQILHADSLYYEKAIGYGKALKKFRWYDTEMKTGMQGKKAEYFENENKILAIERPILDVNIDQDTLFLSGDTVIAVNQKKAKQFWAYPKVRTYKSDLQTVCDSLYYSTNDSVLKLYKEPILWNEENEMKGDTVWVFTKNSKIDRIEFIEKAFIVTQSKGKLFDQVKGRFITGYFKNSKMEKMLVNQNAESLYFGKNDKDQYIGGNQSQSAKMWIYVKENKINKIVFLDKPTATFTPISQMSETMFYLKNFKTNFEKRPLSVEDL